LNGIRGSTGATGPGGLQASDSHFRQPPGRFAERIP